MKSARCPLHKAARLNQALALRKAMSLNAGRASGVAIAILASIPEPLRVGVGIDASLAIAVLLPRVPMAGRGLYARVNFKGLGEEI